MLFITNSALSFIRKKDIFDPDIFCMNRIILFLVFNLLCGLILPLDLIANTGPINGIVKDKESGAPLPFVMVSMNDSHLGVLTDVNGAFSFKDTLGIKKLRFFCSGYKLASVEVADNEKFIQILLQPDKNKARNKSDLSSDIVENIIMKQVILLHDKHNPLNLKEYAYIAHDFVVMAPYGDSILWHDNNKINSSDSRILKLVKERSFFMKESISLKRHLSIHGNQDTLISSREIGVKDPMFLFLISQFQSISFFNSEVTIGNKAFLNPISAAGLIKYKFILRDTLFAPDRHDISFLIDFYPKNDSITNGLKGSMSISMTDWAIKSLKVEPVDQNGFFDVVLYQLSEKRENVWFSTQFRSDLFFRDNKTEGVIVKQSLVGSNRLFINDIHLKGEPSVTGQFLTDLTEPISAPENGIEFKPENRSILLTNSSLSDLSSLNSNVNNFNLQLLSGQVKTGWFSFEINRFLRYNKFEGLNLGLGGHTNADFSDQFTIGGYTGYGFKDTKAKYSADATFWIDKIHQSGLTFLYSYDTRESAGSRFFDESYGPLNSAGFHSFYVKRMDYERKMILSLKTRIGFSTFFVGAQQRIIEKGYDINNGTKILLPDTYNCSGFITGIRFAPGEEPINSNNQINLTNSRYPIIWFQYTKGVADLMKGGFSYNRLESKISYDFAIPRLGLSSILLIGDKVDGSIPYFEYFNGRGAFGSWGLFASGSFVTMHPDEFLNDQLFCLFYTHRFGRVFGEQSIFKIEPAFAFNYGWGELKNKPLGYFLPATDCSKGYLEAGLQINNLIDLKIYNIGLGTYYRMGYYSNPVFKDNLVFKIVINFDKH